MSKPNRLQDALKEKAQGIKPEPKPDSAPQEKTESKEKENSRSGKVMISAYMPEEVRASFRLIQAKHPKKQIQDLMAEALNDLFAKYNVPQSAMLD